MLNYRSYAPDKIIRSAKKNNCRKDSKKINEIGLMEPREVADGFYKLVTQCKNGSVMAVIKDYPPFLIPDYGMVMVLGLGLMSKIANKLSGGLDVVRPIHQFLCLLIFLILLLCLAGWIL